MMIEVEKDLRARLTRVGKLMWDEGLTGKKSLYLSGGNISARIPGTDHILIKPTGICLGQLKPEELIIIDSEGRVLSKEGKPSVETPMHTAVYRTRKDVGGVVHSHPLYCGVFGLAGTELLPLVYGGGVTAELMNGVGIVPWGEIGSKELGDRVAEELKERNAALLEFHGSVAVGKTIEEAYHLASKLEELAELQWRVMALGKKPRLLPETVRRAIFEGTRKAADSTNP